MALRDIAWLSHQANQLNMGEREIPLENFAPPPEYGKPQRDGPESIHNHYHIANERQPTPWYRQKWALWTVIGLVVVFAIAGFVTMGVVLKRTSDGNASSAIGSSNSSVSISASATTKSKQPHSSSTTSEAQATATPFTMLDKSQLASAYVKSSDSTLSRRLLIRQEDTNDLLVTEWANGEVTHYRIKDKLGFDTTEPKPGTPLALQADASGTLHLFYLSRSNVISYVYQQTIGKWKSGEVTNEHGSIRTSAYSSLSAALHNGQKASDMLVVAYDNPSQQLQLVMTNSPTDKASWYIADVTMLSASSAPGQSNVPCYSLAGDWFIPAKKKQDSDNQHLILAVLEESDVHAWECSVDFWPPPEVQVKCKQVNGKFRDGGGKNLTLVPPPKQFAWISLNDGQDKENSNYDFVLLSQDGTGTVRENQVSSGVTRSSGTGFTAKMPIKAISATAEGMVFASTGQDVVVYKKTGSRWQPDVGTNVTFQA